MDNEFFRVRHAVVCVDYTNETHKKLNKILCKGDGGKMNIKTIHIAVCNLDDMDANCLMNLADKCDIFKVKCIVHCFNDMQKEELKNVLKDKIGTYFCIQKESISITLSYAKEGKSITFAGKDDFFVRIKTPRKNGTYIREINYKTMESKPLISKKAIRMKYITESNTLETS